MRSRLRLQALAVTGMLMAGGCMELRMQGTWESIPNDPERDERRSRMVVKGDRLTYIELEPGGAEGSRQEGRFRLVRVHDRWRNLDSYVIEGADAPRGSGGAVVGFNKEELWFQGPGMPARYRRVTD